MSRLSESLCVCVSVDARERRCRFLHVTDVVYVRQRNRASLSLVFFLRHSLCERVCCLFELCSESDHESDKQISPSLHLMLPVFPNVCLSFPSLPSVPNVCVCLPVVFVAHGLSLYVSDVPRFLEEDDRRCISSSSAGVSCV